MKKIHISTSLLLLILLSIFFGKFVLLINYFLALFLHELAHLFIATKQGYSLKRFKLDLFGMSVELNEMIDDKDGFSIHLAGPAFNLLISVVCVAMYWLIPTSYFYLNTFCFANLILAVFNLLPVYPLDGGKIFSGLIKNDKTYRILDGVIRYSLAIMFICAFVITCFNFPNFLLLALALFFITTKADKTPTMSIFKYRQNKHFDKVVILKVQETETLFNLIKQIKSHHYTIFYVPKLNRYFDEDSVIELSLKFQLTTSLSEIT